MKLVISDVSNLEFQQLRDHTGLCFVSFKSILEKGKNQLTVYFQKIEKPECLIIDVDESVKPKPSSNKD